MILIGYGGYTIVRLVSARRPAQLTHDIFAGSARLFTGGHQKRPLAGSAHVQLSQHACRGYLRVMNRRASPQALRPEEKPGRSPKLCGKADAARGPSNWTTHGSATRERPRQVPDISRNTARPPPNLPAVRCSH